MSPRTTRVLAAITEAGHAIAQALVGAAFIGGGGYVAYTALEHEPHDTKILWTGIGVALFGALIFPSIYPMAQRIVVLIFPNGIPLLGGRRKSDPPEPPAP